MNSCFLFLLFTCSAVAQKSQQAEVYLNPNLPITQRVDDLIARMTVEEKISQMVNNAKAIPRLNIPDEIWWNECLHGVARAGTATVFPQAIGLAATWNSDLLLQVADIISTEARANTMILSGRAIIPYLKVLPSGVPTLIFFVIPAGGAGRKPTVKIPISHHEWAWRS